MTLNVHRRRDRKRCMTVRVWLNDVEVTTRCFYVDGRRGVVRCYRLNADGKKYLDRVTGKVAVEELRGKVRWGRIDARS